MATKTQKKANVTLSQYDWLHSLSANQMLLIGRKIYFFVDKARELKYGTAKTIDGTILENHAYHQTIYILKNCNGKYIVCDGSELMSPIYLP